MRVAPVLMHSQHAESVLDQRHLALSASDKLPLTLDAVGLFNVDCAGLDLIPTVKSLLPHFNVNWESLVPETA